MNRRPQRLKFDVLEERALPSWAGVPPLEIAPPDRAAKVGVTSKKVEKFGNSSISKKNEVDYFTFTAPTTGTYQFEATTPKSDMDTVLGVFDTFGNRVAYNDNISGGDSDSRVSYNLLAGTKIFFGITNHIDTPGGKYRWQVTTPGADDKYEENDSIGKAKNLGRIKTSKEITGLKMLDLTDFFKFKFKGKADPTSEVRIDFLHSAGDLELRLFDKLGNLVRTSTGAGNSEVVSLDGFIGSTFYLQVYGFNAATNPNYDLRIDVDATPISKASRTLYLNFDGANISRPLLESMGDGWSNPDYVDFFDEDGDGISIQPFMSSRSDRTEIINLMLYHLKQDLDQFGIKVKRHHGGPVIGKNATTIFLGLSSLDNGFYHVACDIDQGNDNPSDIAFVGNEDWGSAEDTALALADVTLHEAGHTWGLWHVSSGTDAETMGLRYNTPQSQWLKNTTFQDVSYTQFSNHGPGPINTFQTMHTNFGYAFANPTANAAIDTSGDGIFSITTAGRHDVVEVEKLANGMVEVRINGRVYRIGAGLKEIRVYTQGNERSSVSVLGDLGDITLSVDRTSTGMLNNVKVDDSLSNYWRTGYLAHDDGALDGGYPHYE